MNRKGFLVRKTKETYVRIKLNLDGKGENKIVTTIPFFDHMLELFSFHSGIDLYVTSKGDTDIDDHHLVEDIGITLGMVFNMVLKDKSGINRYGEVITPMDESLSYVAVDISGRGTLVYKVKFFPEYKKTSFDYNLIKEFLIAFVQNAKITLHIKLLDGKNNHHICESIFKGLGRAIKEAIVVNKKKIPSSKGVL
ncbi:MAG: imidazoleglycerol-phosphate dehydratase HisB [Endomicrobiia bacterium]